MNKPLLIAQILAHLDAGASRYAGAAREAQAGATDEQSRAENKYDTRGLEASYLAHGQSRQALETAQAREQLAKLPTQFAPGDPIGLGALVELASGDGRFWYFLAPAAGGTEVVCEGEEVLVVTPHSPLGRALLGRRRGENVRVDAGSTAHVHRVVAIL